MFHELGFSYGKAGGSHFPGLNCRSCKFQTSFNLIVGLVHLYSRNRDERRCGISCWNQTRMFQVWTCSAAFPWILSREIFKLYTALSVSFCLSLMTCNFIRNLLLHFFIRIMDMLFGNWWPSHTNNCTNISNGPYLKIFELWSKRVHTRNELEVIFTMFSWN